MATLKNVNYRIKGMNRDLSIAAFNPEFSYENMNVRITAIDNNTLFSIENERGNLPINVVDSSEVAISLVGTPLGCTVLNAYIILFTKDTINNIDYIYRIHKQDTVYTGIILYSGDLNFSITNPIECFIYYENENVQKVYWIDGINQMRLINIVQSDISTYNKNSFDVTPNMDTSDTFGVNKLYINNGQFPAGIVQYFYTFINAYRQETNFVRSSPLYYSTFENKGGSADENTTSAFRIIINNIKKEVNNFEYLRIYSTIRTSLDATPIARKVVDIPLEYSSGVASVDFIDNNTTGEIVDYTSLLYKENSPFTQNAITAKDNTLFLGNYTLLKSLYESIQNDSSLHTFTYATYLSDSIVTYNDIYGYKPNLNKASFPDEISSSNKTYKSREWYRHGYQYQFADGSWTEPFFIGDYQVKNMPNSTYLSRADGVVEYTLVKGVITLNIPEILRGKVVRARPLVVYPEFKDKSVITQGVLNPTVYNDSDRISNLPGSYSSWFFRPIIGGNRTNLWTNKYTDYNGAWSGVACEYRHGKALPGKLHYNCEIISNDDTEDATYTSNSEVIVTTIKDSFHIDHNINTFHSPELYYETLPDLNNLSNLNVRVIGIVPITSNDSNQYLSASTASTVKGQVQFHKLNVKSFNPRTTSDSVGLKGSLAIALPTWRDINAYVDTEIHDWIMYPWGRLNSFINDDDDADHLVKPSSKNLINYRNSIYNIYADYSNELKLDNANINYFNATETTPLLLKGTYNGKDKTVYVGNVDKALVKGSTYLVAGTSTDLSLFPTDDIEYSSDRWQATIVPIQYNSSPHAIVQLSSSTSTLEVLPCVKINNITYGELGYSTCKYFWNNKVTYTVFQNTLQITNSNANTGSDLSAIDSYLLLAEIYREDEDVINRFGGTSKEALQNNKWIPNGKSVNISSTDTTVVLESYGDTYFQRFDCLKTYTPNTDNVQTVTEILSFMVETSINLDCITSDNRGSVAKITPTYTTFNKRNSVYEQTNNYKYYYIPNYQLFNIESFPNSITYSQTKVPGDFVDLWSALTLASTLDTNGNLGAISSLNLFNNSLIGFQDKGIFQILFNSNILINSTTGLPIEIANSGKVEGVRYSSTQIGTTNKWGIVESLNGLYFVDDISTGIYLFNGQLKNLTSECGFFSWLNNIDFTETSWTPSTFGTFKSFYDITNNDVYFVNNNYALIYSETIGQFISFYSYNKTPHIFSYLGNLYSINKVYNSTDNTIKLWEQNKGDYNSYFGEHKPYYITYVVNPEIQSNKIFNNIEYRSDVFNTSNILQVGETFNTLSVWDEYQSGNSTLVDTQLYPSNLKQKFRVWRVNIPRVTSLYTTSRLDDSNKVIGMDRLVNTWCYLKLQNNGTSNNRQVLHDMTVNYTI